MTADTITTERIETLAELARMTWERLNAIWQETVEGEASPADAAAEINEILANLNAANQ